MDEIYSRTVAAIGESALKALQKSRVAVFGVGGVGGAICIALARSGVGEIDIIDKDTVEKSNINRQAVAFHSTVGKYKTEIMKKIINEINPKIKVNTHNLFYLPETADEVLLDDFDYIADAIDNVTAKLTLIKKAKDENIPIISAMGAGNRLDPTRFKVADIFDTTGCPLAKIMRRELKKLGIESLQTVFSDETPVQSAESGVVASLPFVPPVMGYIMAGEIVKGLIK